MKGKWLFILVAVLSFSLGISQAWGTNLANLDSDEDGYTKGEKLQDHDGTWMKEQTDPGDPDSVFNSGDSDDIPSTGNFSISGKMGTRIIIPHTHIVTLTGNALNKTVNTDTEGNYTFTGLSNGTYTVSILDCSGFIPHKGYPAQREVTINNADVTSVNFREIRCK
jgi:hypothetical protein